MPSVLRRPLEHSRQLVEKVGKIMVLFVGVGLLLFGLLYASAFLPRNPIIEHISADAALILSRGQGPIEKIGPFRVTVDGATDAYMMSQTLTHYPGCSAFRQTVLSPQISFSTYNNDVGELINQVSGKSVSLFDYFRYWHGYVLILRPLFTLFSYRQVIYINITVLSLLFLATLYAFKRVSGWFAVGALAVSLFVVGAWAVLFNFQTSNMFFTSCAGVLLVGVLSRKWRFEQFDCYLFLVFGMLTAFFDFLTIPFLSLCLPLLYVVVASWHRKKIYPLLRMFLMTAIWGIGYIGFWVVKWVLAILVLGLNSFSSTWAEITYRMNGTNIPVSRLYVMAANLHKIFPFTKLSLSTISTFILSAELLLIVLLVVVFLRRSHRGSVMFQFGAKLFVIANMPLLWYFVVANHSYENRSFTYRLLVVSIFAVLLLLYYSFRELRFRDLKVGEKTLSDLSSGL